MKKGCFWCLLLCFCFSVGYGQKSSGNKKAREGYEGALLLYKKKQYEVALEVLEKAAAYDDRFAELYFLRADIYNKLKDTEGEIQAIEQGLALDSVKYTGYYFFLAEDYMSQGKYKQAERAYRKYLEKDKKQQRAARARKQLVNCEFALKALREAGVQAMELCWTTEGDVYWPSLDISGETMWYTSLDEGEENIRMRKDSADYFLRFNTKNNEGTQSLTADGQMMYFTGCGRPDSRGSCDIYVVYRLSDTLWSEPVNLGEPVNTDAWEAQPCISPDGTKLFFASNREGGKGGSDIWYSTLLRREKDGRQFWSQPKLLYFNTEGQEMAPFLYYDGKTLFFASDGYPGMGGMDIYKVNLDSVNEPIHLGAGINTYKDEVGFMVDASGKKGYFASDRSGRKNIYSCELPPLLRCPEIGYFRLLVQDQEGKEVIPDRIIVENITSGDTLAFYEEPYMPSQWLAAAPENSRIWLGVLKKGYVYYSDTLETGKGDYLHPWEQKVVLREIEEGKSLVLKGIFFDVDDYTLKPESESELKQLVFFLQQNPQVCIEISGHTDDSGSEEHNNRLSEDRAFEVYKYLFIHHIDKGRMTYKGYGRKRPVASNETETGRARNRRTEITIYKREK